MKSGLTVDRALDAQMMAQLEANEGLVQTHPAITFVPEHEVQRQKKEQQRMLSKTLAEAILEKHRSKQEEKRQEIIKVNENDIKALKSLDQEKIEKEKKKQQDKVKLM